MSSAYIHCDVTIAGKRQSARDVSHPNWLLATTVLASGLAFIDGSVVNVGLPAVGVSLRADAADLQWIINAYLLPLSAVLLLGGAAGDRYGHARLLVVGVLSFGAASVACALAPTLPWLLAFRGIQGVGAALLMPNSLAIIGEHFWGLTIGSGHAGWTPAAILSVIAGGALLAAFLVVERSKRDAAMMPISLFGSSSFIGITLLTLLLYGALSALLVLIPYVLIQASGYSAAQSGAALLPFAIVLALTSPLTGALAGKIGPRVPLIIGPLVVAGGFFLISRVGPQTTYWTTVFPAIMVIAIGMAGAVAPLTTAVFASVDARHNGAASGFNSAIARTGGLVATALLGGVLDTTGSVLVSRFHIAGLVCSLASGAAAVSAFFLITVGASSKSDAPPSVESPRDDPHVGSRRRM